MFLKTISKISLLLFLMAFSYADDTTNSNAFSVSKESLKKSKSKQKRIEKVIVSGIGINQNSAIQNASRTALQQVVGMYVVSDVVMQNRKLIKDEILSTSNGFIKSFKVLNKTHDKDGLVEIEAEVEVEINKLTTRLDDLNVALKHVGTDNLKAISFDKISSKKDFKEMAEKVIFEPIDENKIWKLKIIDFKPIDDDMGFSSRSAFKSSAYDDLLPFILIFKVSTSKEYYNSVMQFIEKNSQDKFSEKESSSKLITFRNQQDKFGSNRKKVINYKLSIKKIEVLNSIIENRKKSTYTRKPSLHFDVSLYNKEGLFKQSSLWARARASGSDFPMTSKMTHSIQQKYKVNTFSFYSMKFISPSPMRRGITFKNNNLTFGVIVLLSENDIEQLEDIKIGLEKRL